MPAEDRIGHGAPGRAEMEVATLRMHHEPLAHEPSEHLAGGLGRDAQVAGDLGGVDPPGVLGAGHHPEGEQVLLGGGGQVAGIVMSRHDLRIRDGASVDPSAAGERSRWRVR